MPNGVPPLWQPSSARSVALDGLLPLPRGVMPADVQPLSWPTKDPGDVLDYSLDVSAALAGDATDQVATISVSAQPYGGAGDLLVGRIVASGTLAVVWLSGGVSGTTYSVVLNVGTLKGRVIGRTILLPVAQLTAAAVASNPLITDAGGIVTDQNGNPILVGP